MVCRRVPVGGHLKCNAEQIWQDMTEEVELSARALTPAQSMYKKLVWAVDRGEGWS